MYLTYFLIGFCTSFGWWAGGKVQKNIDQTPTAIVAPEVKKE